MHIIRGMLEMILHKILKSVKRVKLFKPSKREKILFDLSGWTKTELRFTWGNS